MTKHLSNHLALRCSNWIEVEYPVIMKHAKAENAEMLLGGETRMSN